jgi:hypothetical protein
VEATKRADSHFNDEGVILRRDKAKGNMGYCRSAVYDGLSVCVIAEAEMLIARVVGEAAKRN